MRNLCQSNSTTAASESRRFSEQSDADPIRPENLATLGTKWPAQARIEYDPHAGAALILDLLGPTTLVAIHPEYGRPTGCWLDQAALPVAGNWARAQNGSGWNIYFTANKPRDGIGKKPTKTDIEAIRCVYADVDAKDGRTLDQALAAIHSQPLQPSFIIMTGGGWQPIYSFAEPMPATLENIHRAEALGKRLAELLESDAVQNIDRILRLPFTKNFPNARKQAAGRIITTSGVLLRSAE